MSGPTCQSCGRELLFVENVASGARVPLVRTPTRVVSIGSVSPGMVVVSPSRRKGRFLTLESIRENEAQILEAAADGRLHVSHFGDCRQSAEWSSGRRRRVR